MSGNYPPHRIVAWNLRRARELQGWSADEAAERLEPFLGQRWSKATFSVAEAYNSARVRRFSVDELVALSRAFEVNIAFFFMPPTENLEVGFEDASESSSTEELLDAVLGLNKTTREWVNHHVPMNADGSRALRRWRDEHAALTELREAFLAELLAAHEALADEAAASESLAYDAREALVDEAARREPARRELERLVNEPDDGEQGDARGNDA